MNNDAIIDDPRIHLSAQAQKLIDVGLVAWMTADMREAWLCENTWDATMMQVEL